ncbi:MAG: hypothetical protein PVG39_02145 [Desulfobacteraceae bacterium]|jgi:hypothetical protein
MISICDIKNIDGNIEVVDQRDFNIPDLSGVDFACDVCAKANCDCGCDKCVIKRITEGRGECE